MACLFNLSYKRVSVWPTHSFPLLVVLLYYLQEFFFPKNMKISSSFSMKSYTQVLLFVGFLYTGTWFLYMTGSKDLIFFAIFLFSCPNTVCWIVNPSFIFTDGFQPFQLWNACIHMKKSTQIKDAQHTDIPKYLCIQYPVKKQSIAETAPCSPAGAPARWVTAAL